jgi:transposase (fragment)
MLVSKLISLNAEPDSIIIGLESTAHYGDNLVRYLVAEKFQVYVEPHQDFYYAKE